MLGWPTVALGLALGLTGLAALMLRQVGVSAEPINTEKITLRSLAQVWLRPMRGAKGGIPGREHKHISELAHLWRDESLIARGMASYEFTHPRAQAFYDKLQDWPCFKQASSQREVCIEMLRLLDQEGNCPSVVNVQGDVEAGWEANTYQILGQTTLLEHSLNVAEQVVQLLSDLQAWHVIPDTLVAALGHDLGKLNLARGSLYSLGEHPLASCAMISGVAGFKELARKDEILKAIKLHHKMSDGLLGKTLKKADQQARQKELESWTGSEAVSEGDSTAQVTPEHAQAAKITIATQHFLTNLSTDQAETVSPQGKSKPPGQADISSWFDAAAFLDLLKPHINRVDGRRYLAFSMANGLVYFQVKALEETARKQATQAGCMHIAAMAQDDLSMREVLLSIVQRLRQHEVIAEDLIKPNFFGGYFLVTRRHGKELKGYYTPFHAEAFGSIAGMEQAKPALLRDIIKVSPFTASEEAN